MMSVGRVIVLKVSSSKSKVVVPTVQLSSLIDNGSSLHDGPKTAIF